MKLKSNRPMREPSPRPAGRSMKRDLFINNNRNTNKDHNILPLLTTIREDTVSSSRTIQLPMDNNLAILATSNLPTNKPLISNQSSIRPFTIDLPSHMFQSTRSSFTQRSTKNTPFTTKRSEPHTDKDTLREWPRPARSRLPSSPPHPTTTVVKI